MKTINFYEVTPEELQEQIANNVKSQLQDFFEHYKPKQPNDYLTRQEVADMLRIDLSTVHNWCKKGKLKPYGIGHRVYFLRSDIEKSLTPLNS